MVRHDSRGIAAPALLGLVLALAVPVVAHAQSAPAQSTPAQPAAAPSAPLPPAAGQPIRIQPPLPTPGGPVQGTPILHKVTTATERMELTVTTSRILTLDQKIPQAQVNNPDILELTPLSPNQIQIFAKKPGVTQVNLWDENNRIFTIDVIVFADARELEMLLRSEFPNATLHVRPVSQGVLISGYVDHPQHVSRIVQLAEEYYPKVINNIAVGGVQKVVLHTKVMEVSRTKLRSLGFDFAQLSSSGGALATSISGLLATFTKDGVVQTAGNHTVAFNITNGSNAFFGVLEAMRENNLMKVLAEPDIVAISGRPASFNVGGEIPVLVPQSLGTVAIEWKKWGTQIDFVPIVLGNGQIRLEVRPRVSEIDPSRSVTLDSYVIPGLLVREVETGVEMKAGQTLAIAGLVQDRTESLNRGLPWVSDLPYVGAFFRRVHENRNEVELLILVTPELIEAVDPEELPPCGPGTTTVSPTDHEFYWKGHVEVPACCGICGGAGCTVCRLRSEGSAGPAPCETQQAPSPASANSRPAASVRVAERTTGRSAVPNYYNRANRQSSPPQPARAKPAGELPGFLGPVGYDVAQ